MDSYSIEPYGLSRKRLKHSIQSGKEDIDFRLYTDHAFSMSENPFDYLVDTPSRSAPSQSASQVAGSFSIMPDYGYGQRSSLEASSSSDALPPRAVPVPALNPSTWLLSLQQNLALSPSQDPEPQQAAQVLAAMAATSVDRPDQCTTVNGSQSSLDLPTTIEDFNASRSMSFQRNQAQAFSWTSFIDSPANNLRPKTPQPHTSSCLTEVILPCITECDEDDCASVCSEPDLCESGCADDCNIETVCSNLCLEALCEDASCLEGVEIIKDKTPYVTAGRETHLNNNLFDSVNSQCLWVSDDGYCKTTFPSSWALEQHVFKDHIEPQTAQICPYECGATLDRGEIIQHMSREHAYMCFEYGCDFQSTDCEHLHQHVQSAHSQSKNAECHWDECSVTALDSTELNGHVVAEHLTIPSSLNESAVRTITVSSPVEVCELASSARDEKKSLDSPTTDQKHLKLMVLPNSSIDRRKKVCRWIAHDDPTNICEMAFEKPNDLQDHVEKIHIQPLMGLEAKLCRWKGCCKANQHFKHKAKLKVHLRSHTGCTDY